MRPAVLLALIGCCLWVADSDAAQYADQGDYRVHYTTFSSLIIPPEVATAHSIVRAENRIIINLSILKLGEPAAAVITGNVTNLLNQRFELEFTEVDEAEAIYYLASHTSLPQDILRFDLQVEFMDTEPLPIRFVRRYD